MKEVCFQDSLCLVSKMENNLNEEEFINDDPTFICMSCKQKKRIEFFYQLELSICDSCAEKIANIWYFSHGGRYLTWETSHNHKQKKVIPTSLRWKIFKRDGFKCVKCDSQEDLTVDHIYPEKLGGTLLENNLQTFCRRCNSRKGVRYG